MHIDDDTIKSIYSFGVKIFGQKKMDRFIDHLKDDIEIISKNRIDDAICIEKPLAFNSVAELFTYITGNTYINSRPLYDKFNRALKNPEFLKPTNTLVLDINGKNVEFFSWDELVETIVDEMNVDREWIESLQIATI